MLLLLACAHTPVDRPPAPWTTPGLVDAHAHPLGLGLGLARLDLVGIDRYADLLAAISSAPAGEGWLLGRGWDQNRWPDGPGGPDGGWPLASDLDARWPDRPVFLKRVDGHAGWANSAALRAAGIGPATPDPPGGRIVRGPDGAPSGVLIDTAVDLVPVPAPTDAEIEAALLAAQDAMLSAGLVGVHDMGVDDAALAAYRRLDADGRLRVHVAAFLSAGTAGAETLLASKATYGRRLHVVGIKAYADGALGSRGARLSAPYADEPGQSGLWITPHEALQALAIRCLRARVILAVHAIGDRAVSETLDAYAAARAAVPEAANVPLRIEHAQVVRPEDQPRFASLGVIASMQPTHATSDMPWAEARLGPERIGWAYAWRDLEQAGATLVFGSDFPVERHEPALGLWAAVRRQDPAGKPAGGWHPEQALTWDEALDAFSTATWPAAGLDVPQTETVWTGSLDAGLKPVATVIDGNAEWRSP